MLASVLACLACPYCGLGLSAVDGTLRCGNGHSFDLARQGYVTLLPAGARGSGGDDARMVAARAEFLAAGHYAPLTAALVAASGPNLASGPDLAVGPDLVASVESADGSDPAASLGSAAGSGSATGPGPAAGLDSAAGSAGGGAVLDVGAGTGHHLAAVLDAAPGAAGIALDASRYAARRAARAHPRAGAVVADAWTGLPVRTGSIAVVLDVFSPRNGAETARVLRPGGLLVVVTPGPDHLTGLVDVLGGLQVDAAKDTRLAAALEPHLRPLDRAERRWALTLPHADAVRAVAMGPSARHLADIEAAVRELPDPVRATASIVVTRYRRD
jgi:23S rRNA (guanine745-N1)-methyltransferase